ncbi:MAG: tetratricopeptide repeat protein [Planctomycetaceae bacterium]|nr:tetratricopeptide repeat protein [Planctomycetaceae bacterium]
MTEQSSTSGSGGPDRRLQQLFQRANTLLGQGNHDYAHELFSQCVIADPGNVVYTQTCLANLFQKHGDKKKGSMFAGFGSKGGVKAASLKKDWKGVIKSGLSALKANPRDTSTFLAMADACGHMDHSETQAVYLRFALKFNPDDLHINRVCGPVFRERKEFELAELCWRRVLKAKPDDEEAQRQIGQIAAEMTVVRGGYENAETSRDVKKAPSSTAGVQRDELSPEEQLKRQIAKNPRDKAAYDELANLYMRADNLEPAERILAKAREEFPDDLDILEKLEDIQMRHLRELVARAEREAQETGSDEANKAHKVARARLALKETEHYEHLVERYPSNNSYHLKLGQRYQQLGKWNEAIQQFQQARNDPKHHGLCQLELGKCFQQIKQYKLASDHYANAVREISDQDEKNKKDALYHATKLELGLKNYDAAEQYGTTLAAMDFGYKDVAALLDKIAQNRED